MSDKNVVSIKNLSKSYKLDNGHEVQALKNIQVNTSFSNTTEEKMP